MKHKLLLTILASICCLAVLFGILFILQKQNQIENTNPTINETTVNPTTPTESPTTSEQTPQSAMTFTLSFAGDCTLGTSHNTYGNSGTFVKIVGDDYSYPFKNALQYFENDDFTMVNLEGAFTDYNVPEEKTFRFRGPSSYSKILTAGSVEAVNLANNHSMDYGKTGYADTKKALESENVTYVEDTKTAYFDTANGLRIGLYAAQFDLDDKKMANAIQELRKNGAELVIVSIHWGVEGSYRPNDDQKNHAHAAIDAGADIVYGHHPHVLQPIETYKNGVIYYSLGNFSFGGNRNPRDKDTAVIQQAVIRETDGTVRLGDTTIIPFSQSSVSSKNDYQPTPYLATSSKYKRVLSKLDGTFTGKDLVVDYGNSESETPETSTTTQPSTLAPSNPTTESTTEPTTTPTTSPTTKPTTRPIDPTDDEFHIPI